MIYCSQCGDDAHEGECDPQSLMVVAGMDRAGLSMEFLATTLGGSLRDPVPVRSIENESDAVGLNQPGPRVSP